jgi:hypothetical protein
MASCECVGKDIEGLLKFFTSYLDYNQIGLNGLEDDPLLFYIFLCSIATLAPKSTCLENKNSDPHGCSVCDSRH